MLSCSEVTDKVICAGSQLKTVDILLLGSAVEMRRRKETERRPDITSVQKKMASLPLKVSAATQTNECHAMTDECHVMTDKCHAMTDKCHDMSDGCHDMTDKCHVTTDKCHDRSDGCHAMTDGCHATTDTGHVTKDRCHAVMDGCHMLTQECHHMTSRTPVEFTGAHSSSRLDRLSSSCCSCADCLLSLPTSDLGLEDDDAAADCHLFVFEDDFERLSEAEYQVDDDEDGADADANQFIEFCFEETSRYLDEISHGSKDIPHPDLCLDLPPQLLFPVVQGKLAVSGNGEDYSVGEMALIETGSSHNDSGIGRTTDESVRADDSSEQEMLENYFQPYRFHHSSGGGGNLSSAAALAAFPLETTMLLNDVDANRKGMTSNFCQDLGEMSRDFEQMHLQSLVTTEAQPNQRRNVMVGQMEKQPSGRTFLPPPTPPKQRIVPRMGTRSDFCRHANGGGTAVTPCHDTFPLTLPGSFGNDGEVIWARNANRQTNPDTNNFLKMIASYQIRSDGLRSSDRNDLTMTSAYHTGNSSSCSSTPVFPQKPTNPPTSEQKKRPLPDGQPLSTRPWKTRSNDPGAVTTRTNMASQTVGDCEEQTSETVPDACQLTSLQKLYAQYVDVMYTNHANLEHTIMVQQKLFSQQIQLNNARKTTPRESKPSETHPSVPNPPIPVPSSPTEGGRGLCCPEDQTPMEWVVRRRSDGSRYIARRPLRNQILKDRAQRLTEERSGVTTDDDAASEMKLGRYWSRDKRKVHLERARFHREQKELRLQRQKMETVRENDDHHNHQPNIIELSRRKVMRHKSKKLLDGFTTVQELLAHGNAEPFGGRSSNNPLLSVTTV